MKEIGCLVFGILTGKLHISEGLEKIGWGAFRYLEYISLPSTLKEIAPDFYYEECVGSCEYPPYIEVHPDNPCFYAEGGTLYYKGNNKRVLDGPYNGREH